MVEPTRRPGVLIVLGLLLPASLALGAAGAAAGGAPFTIIWSGEGNQSATLYGGDVVMMGDVDGDGFGDFAVGAGFYDLPGLQNIGRVFLYHGGPGGVWTPATAVLEGGARAEDRFGQVVAAAGDVNQDGFDDLIVGSPDAYVEINGTFKPRVGFASLYLGGPEGLAATPAWKKKGTTGGVYYGKRVAGAGDVDGDGFDDVLVSATGLNRVDLFRGGPNGLEDKPWCHLQDGSDISGLVIAPAGDMNEDGMDDFFVSSVQGLRLYHGAKDPTQITLVWTAPIYGYEVAVGDLNGDGFRDVVIGDPRMGDYDHGIVHVYYGGPGGLPETPSQEIPGTGTNQNFGWSVAVGDVNGDGLDDAIVGSCGRDLGYTSYAGKTVVFLGRRTGLSQTGERTLAEGNSKALFGFAVASGADVDGDGIHDILVGAPSHSGDIVGEGGAWLYRGGNHAPSTPRNLRQFHGDGTTLLGLGETAAGTSVLLGAELVDALDDGDRLRLEIEVRPVGVPFTGEPSAILTGEEAMSGMYVEILVDGLPPSTSYRWRARAVDARGMASGWVAYGNPVDDIQEPDFTIRTNAAPEALEASQVLTLTGAAIPIGAELVTAHREIRFSALLTDVDAPETLFLEVEVRPLGDPFLGVATSTSPAAVPGEVAGVVLTLTEGAWCWRYRGVDVFGAASPWTDYGGNSGSEPDFVLTASGSVGNSTCLQGTGSSAAAWRFLAVLVLLALPAALLRRA